MDQKEPSKTYLIYGDSGSGKSSFIKHLNGIDQDGNSPKTGGGGDACTSLPGKIYSIDLKRLGHLKLIDTRGTCDPAATDNTKIVEDLVQALIDFSVQNMEDKVTPVQQIDGVIYVHSSLQYDRFYRDIRIAHLSTLIGFNLVDSTVDVLTHYNSILQLDLQIKDKFQTMIQDKHYKYNDTGYLVQTNQYVFWDSGKVYEGQIASLKEALLKIVPFNLKNIQQSNMEIIDLANQLRENDLKETEVIHYNTIDREKYEYEMEREDREDKIAISVECPQSFFAKFLKPYTNVSEWNEVHRIDPSFPKRALPPKKIVSCKIKNASGLHNVVFITEPTFVDKGDYWEVNLKYAWKNLDGTSSNGRIDLKFNIEIQYRVQNVIKYQLLEQTKTIEMLPRYNDEKVYSTLYLYQKPYLQIAKEKCMNKIFQDLLQITKQDHQQEATQQQELKQNTVQTNNSPLFQIDMD